MTQSTLRLALCGAGILLAACAMTPPASDKTAAAPSSPSCTVVEGNPSPQDALASQALQRNIETSPLFTIPASGSGLSACRIRYQPDAVIALEYQFKQGGWLHVKRDARIEYTEQDARFALTSNELPEAIMARAEHAAFGADGCGIDWRQPETRPSDEVSGAIETLFRGDACNCQARIRRDANGRVIGLMLRSAC